MECSTKKMIVFTKHSILDIWHGSEYISGSLKLFCRGCQRVLRIVWYMPNWLYSIHSKLWIFPKFRRHTWKYNIQAKKRLTKVKEKLIWCFLSFFHFLHCNVPDNKCYKEKWGVLFFTRIKLVARVLSCARVIARIKWKRL